jgi:hypothetical protein
MNRERIEYSREKLKAVGGEASESVIESFKDRPPHF